jgi:hypothetical protein
MIDKKLHPYGPGCDATLISIVISELIHAEMLQLLEEVYLSDNWAFVFGV